MGLNFWGFAIESKKKKVGIGMMHTDARSLLLKQKYFKLIALA